jgi:uncharacterized tellurite resistance protein B-like protein
MFGDLLRRLTQKAPDRPLPALDARLAVGARVVRVAKSDNHYAFEEIAKIDRLLAHSFALNPVEAAKMRADCERLEAQAPATETYTAMIREHVAYGERAALYDGLWQVSLADQALEASEEAFLTQIAEALGITAEDIALTVNRHRNGG